MEKKKLVDTKKWSTGYLNPKGFELYDKYSELSYEELIIIANDLTIKYDKDISKDELMMKIIKKNNGISKMKNK